MAFGRFLLLPENRSGLLAVRRMVRHLGRYRPERRAFPVVFVHGPVGSGKSHLVQVLVEQIQNQVPEFTLQVLPAVEVGSALLRLGEERTQYLQELQSLDLLILEDMQFLPVDAAETLASLLDYRQARFGALCVTANVGPAQLHDLPARLQNRLASGIVTGIEALSKESRRKLAIRWLQDRRITVTSEVLDWLIQQTGPRGILGEIQRFDVLRKSHPMPLTLPIIQTVSKESNRSGTSSIERIVQHICQHFQVTMKQVKGKARHRNVLWPRQVSMYLTRKLTTSSLVEIGRFFGGRDHTTVKHACEKVAQEIQHDTSLANTLRKLQAELE